MDYVHPDETDLDTYDTDHLARATPTPAIRAELARRTAAEAARRRCDECWHEGGDHAPACSSVTQATRCGCCESDGERPVAGQTAASESYAWVEAMLPRALRGGVL